MRTVVCGLTRRLALKISRRRRGFILIVSFHIPFYQSVKAEQRKFNSTSVCVCVPFPLGCLYAAKLGDFFFLDQPCCPLSQLGSGRVVASLLSVQRHTQCSVAGPQWSAANELMYTSSITKACSVQICLYIFCV